MSINDLPAYLTCPNSKHCTNKHFLTIHKTSENKWCGGYLEFENNEGFYGINDADTLDELAARLHASLKRNKAIV